ncbi:MAG: glycosyl hydrolase [Acidobacteriota bacterium]
MTPVGNRARSFVAPLILCLVTIVVVALGQPAGIEQLQRGFERPPDDSRIMMRWWWFGPAVTKPRLEREMQLMKAAGIGGFEIQPVYPVALDEAASSTKTTEYLSDEFIEALRFTADTARELGLRVDLTIGSGWPFGGPTLSVDQAAGKLRVERVKITDALRRVPVPYIGAGEKLLAVFLTRIEGQSVSLAETREITGSISDGVVKLPALQGGTNEVQFFISSRTGQQVKRPSIGGEGFVLDHYDRSAVDHYLKTVGDRLLQAFGSRPPHAIFCDSLEVYLSDWAPDMLVEFRKRRGYDLKPYLPALVADAGESTAAIRYDWGKTLTELLNERFLAAMREWARRNGTLFRIQGYGVPPMTLSGNAYADLPEGEGTHWKVVRASRWASSASHLYGRPVTSSETWTWLHSPSFRATPLDVKAEADLHFLQGINQLIGHGWPYTPDEAEYPGNRFYAAAVFSEKNPWWLVMPDLALYLQRVSFLLRQGQPANDVALYLPNSDAWAGFSNGRVHMIEALRDHVGPDIMPAILEAGFNLDFVDDDALKTLGKVEQGALALGTNRYKAVVLPNVERIPPETLRILEEFAAVGGVVIASRRSPAKAPGLKATPAEQAQVRDLSRRLFEGAAAKGHVVTDEKAQLGPKLTSLVVPDLTLSPAVADIGFIRRHLDGAEIYFVANSSNQRHQVKARFRVRDMQPELWNPLIGTITALAAEIEATGVTIPLDLEPYGSRLVVFTKRSLPRPQVRSTTLEPAAIDISRGWRVTFKPASGETPKPVVMDQLRSWSDADETKYFSGTASYEKEIDIPADFVRRGPGITIDFGEGQSIQPINRRNGMQAWYEGPVRDAAEVFVNGQRAGSVWLPPYTVNIGSLVKPGANSVRIVVGNTAINYLAGRKLPDYKLLNLRYGERFQPQDMENLQPLPSGLLGTIHLRAK